MGKKISYLLFIVLFVFVSLKCDRLSLLVQTPSLLDKDYQESKDKFFETKAPFSYFINGLIGYQSIFDSRQNFSFFEGYALGFPKPKKPDRCGNDRNKPGQFNMYSIESLLGIGAFGPDFYGAKSRAYIEADFIGFERPGLFRLRHAFFELTTDNFSWLTGKTWHPITYPIVSPDAISFNAGAPIAPFARNSQLRAYFIKDNVEVIAIALGHVDFDTEIDGPLGISNIYYRNARIPELHLHTRISFSGDSYIGGGINYIRIVPRIITNKCLSVREKLDTFAGDIYTKLKFEQGVLYGKLTYAENAQVFDMIGGYAVHTVDSVTDKRTYTPTRTVGVYAELVYQPESFEPAIFIGIAKNLGAPKTILTHIKNEKTIYGLGNGLGNCVDTVIRVSPRVRWYHIPVVFGVELEYTRASFGKINRWGNVIGAKPVGNIRLILAGYYSF